MGISNQEKSNITAEAIREFIRERDELKDYADWIQKVGPTAGKGIQRKRLADLLGVSTSTLNANRAAVELQNAEARWCGALNKDSEETSKAKRAELDRARTAEKRAKGKAGELEGSNITLKAENRLLRSRLGQYEAIDQLLMEAARAPRKPMLEG